METVRCYQDRRDLIQTFSLYQLLLSKTKRDCFNDNGVSRPGLFLFKIICPPPWPEAKKNHLRSKWDFLASGQGGGHDIFSTSFNFQCAIPRGLIRWVTVGCNYSLLGHFGFSFKFSMCYPKGAHLFTHRWLQLLTFWGILDSVSNFQCATSRGLICWVTVGCNYSIFGHLDSVSKRNTK